MSLIKAGLPCTLGCNSSDAMAEYENGKFCFSCKRQEKVKIKNVNKEAKRDVVYEDFWITSGPSVNQAQFLSKFGIFSGKLKEVHKPYFISRYKSYQDLIGFKVGENSLMARNLGGVGPKWVRAELNEFGIEDRNKNFYLHDPEKEFDNLVVTEDPISALTVHYAGFTSLSLNGTGFSKPRLDEMLSKKFKKMHLWLDDDKAGHEASWRLALKLQPYLDVKIIFGKKEAKYLSEDDIKGILV